MAFPLITLPYLSRVLGPKGWGLVAFTQAFAAYLVLLVDFGFTFSATRAAAQAQDDPRHLSEIVSDVWGAKAIMSVVALALCVVAYAAIDAFRSEPALLAGGAATAIGYGCSLTWLFLALQELRPVAVAEVATRLLAVAGIFMFVRQPGHEWRVLAIQGAAAGASILLVLPVAARRVRVVPPTLERSLRMLRDGWSTFVSRGAIAAYTTGNAFVLGLVAPVSSVAFYSGGDRISRGVVGMLNPLNQAMFPRLSSLVSRDRRAAGRVAWRTALLMLALGCVLAVVLTAGAPVIVRFVLGPDYASSAVVLRILAAALPAIALSNALGINWMLAMGMDREFMWIILTAAASNLAAGVLLSVLFAHRGMAVTVVAVESAVAVATIAVLARRGLLPSRNGLPAGPPEPL
ncbi:MAG TPA: oligosaccharide flippase family protein [Actinomycetota bacterium]|nr:oligosaccharide flippase family protein [Actinomycetota bacterium]